MPRHIDQNGVTDALLIISILKQIPTSRWISGPQIQQNLSELGIEIEARRMQRLLKSIRDCEQLHVDVNDKSNIRCHTTFRHPFNLSWSGKTCDIRRSSKTTS